MYDLARKLVLSVVLAALAAPLAHAQQRPLPESSRQKTEEALKKGAADAVDDAYKALEKRTPSAAKKVDPWGDVRSPPAKSGK